jgi:hypothetical protein
MRGFQGAFGGLGVFTKCALKLYRWDGPAEMEVEGCSPMYALKEVPPRMALNAIAFPSSKAMRDAGYKLGEADIEYAQFRTPMFFVALGMSRNNRTLKKILESGMVQRIGRFVVNNAVIGYSDREFKWKMKVLRQILAETGGVMLPVVAGLSTVNLMGPVRRLLKRTRALLTGKAGDVRLLGRRKR